MPLHGPFPLAATGKFLPAAVSGSCRFTLIPDKIGKYERRLRRHGDPQLPANLFTFEEICHVVAQQLHRLHPFQIPPYLFWICSMDHVPITGGDNRHLHKAEILVHLIPSGGRTGPSGRKNHCSRLKEESPPPPFISAQKPGPKKKSWRRWLRPNALGCRAWPAGNRWPRARLTIVGTPPNTTTQSK